MKILLHICCAPCAIYPFYRLQEQGMEITGYFYNPNIHPYQEYRKRVDTLMDFSVRAGLDMVHRGAYELDKFLLLVAGTAGRRCEHCYRMRLNTTAEAAKKHKVGAFTSSLLYSKYQNHDLIKGIALEAAEEHGVEFYYEDFRRGWREGIMESKAMGLYRQQYCGCIYSEQDRYEKK